MPLTPAFAPRHLAQVLEGIREPAAVIGADYAIVAANRAYHAKFAPSGGTLTGALCHQVSHGYDVSCLQKGEACPIQPGPAVGESCQVVHEHFTRLGVEHEELTVFAIGEVGERPDLFLEIVRPLRLSGGRAHGARLLGRSPAFRELMRLIDRVAASDAPVLLLGESGTGKELAAATVHRRSARGGHHLVAVDCSGLPESLFESELLGHERGAFTGATHTKRGLVEAAAGGTLFLDEVGDVPLSQQVKLLRLLDTGTFRRVGGLEQHHADFRLICATHRDLEAMVGEGRFRQDLYYRIGAFPIRLPPLRERPEDLPLLATRLLQQLDTKRPRRLSPASLQVLGGHRFPGNVRELVNILQRACLLADGEVIEPEHLPTELTAPLAGSAPAGTRDSEEGSLLSVAEVERRYLRRVLEGFTGDRRSLARQLGMSDRTLYRRLAELRDPDPT